MYLDKNELNEVEKVVMRYYLHLADLSDDRLYARASHSTEVWGCIALLIGVSMYALIPLWITRPQFVSLFPFLLPVIMIFFTYIGINKSQRMLKKLKSPKVFREVKERVQEIKMLDALEEDRTKFFALIAAMQGEPIDNVIRSVDDAMCSTALSQLTFVRDVHAAITNTQFSLMP